MGQIFLTAANAVLPIVLLILMGYCLKRAGFLSEGVFGDRKQAGV